MQKKRRIGKRTIGRQPAQLKAGHFSPSLFKGMGDAIFPSPGKIAKAAAYVIRQHHRRLLHRKKCFFCAITPLYFVTHQINFTKQRNGWIIFDSL
jgi:hypothetical protein